jgi:hypothetical protein
VEGGHRDLTQACPQVYLCRAKAFHELGERAHEANDLARVTDEQMLDVPQLELCRQLLEGTDSDLRLDNVGQDGVLTREIAFHPSPSVGTGIAAAAGSAGSQLQYLVKLGEPVRLTTRGRCCTASEVNIPLGLCR